MIPKQLSFNLGIGTNASSNISDSEVAAEFFKLYNAVNLLAAKLDEYTGAISEAVANRPYLADIRVNKGYGVTRLYKEATVDLVKGTIVYINASGKLAKAAAANGALSFIVLENTALGNFAPIARHAVVDGFVGLTTGSTYVNSTTAGAIATSVAAGNTRRYIGFALSSTVLYFCPDIVGIAV